MLQNAIFLYMKYFREFTDDKSEKYIHTSMKKHRVNKSQIMLAECLHLISLSEDKEFFFSTISLNKMLINYLIHAVCKRNRDRQDS